MRGARRPEVAVASAEAALAVKSAATVGPSALLEATRILVSSTSGSGFNPNEAMNAYRNSRRVGTIVRNDGKWRGICVSLFFQR
jgi:hypothetical protein